MADTFDDLGIAPELAAGVRKLGWERPTPLQRDATPVLRRGNNLVLHASSGAGVLGAWALPLLDRLIAGDAGRLLVLLADDDAASRTAGVLARLGGPAGVAVRALAGGWTARNANVLVATPATALAAVRDSSLKIDDVDTVVVHGADAILELGDWQALQTLAAALPGHGQRVVATGRFPDPVERFIEGHARKALTIPPRPAEDTKGPAGSSVRFVVVPDPARLDAVVALLDLVEADEVAIVCRSPQRAERVGEGLAGRGVPVEGVATAAAPDADGSRTVVVLPAGEADRRSTRAAVISHDPPFDDEGLAALHERGGLVIAGPGELAHLRRIATRAGFRLEPATLPRTGAAGAAEAVRERIRAAIADRDLAAYLSLVEPLLEEFSPAEVAAAAVAIARRAEAGAAPADATPATARAPTAGAPPPDTAFVRLFVSAGSRDGIGPGDLVGAITGETGVSGDRVGRIEVRDTHSTIEVGAELAPAVIAALNGRTLRGRSLRVDYDRKERTPPEPRDRRPGGGRPPGRPGGRPGGGRPGGRSGGGRPGGGGPRGGGSRGGGPRGGGSRDRRG